jgi:hypothetical protein
MRFIDVWADPILGTPIASLDILYGDLTTPIPTIDASINCSATWIPWDPGCRTIINYEEHIHPLWSLPRAAGVRTCTASGCHNSAGLIPAAQLDLTNGPSDQDSDHFKAYRELLFTDNEVDINGQDVQVFAGNLIDPDTGLEVLDADGNPIPTFEPVVAQGPSISVIGSRAGTFMDRFLPGSGNAHEGDLTAEEIRLLAEWIDIGAQYYNRPFDAPEN